MDNPFEQDNRYGAYSGNYPPNPGPPPPLPNPSGVPPPPPRPPSTPYAAPGYANSQQNLYDNPYNPNPYDPHAHTPSPFDNPNSLYTNSGQVIGHSTPTPDPFINHPSLYDPHSHSPYGPPSSTPASDRYNTPAPLPGQPRITTPHNDYLNPSPAATGGPRVHYELNDPNDGADGGDIPLLRRDGASAITPIDGSSMRESYALPGGFDPSLLPESDENNIRYGRIPQRVPRRYKTKKRYECVFFRLVLVPKWGGPDFLFFFSSSNRLFHGNLVIDNEVPSKLLDVCPLKNEREFKFMRYTAATCDPNDFKTEVRPSLLPFLFSLAVSVRNYLTWPFYKGLYPPSGHVRARAQNGAFHRDDHVQRRRGALCAHHAGRHP